MKTFFGVFSREALSADEIKSHKKYTFKTNNVIEEQLVYYSPEYKKHIFVLKIIENNYEFVCIHSHDLSNEKTTYPYVRIKEVTMQLPDTNKEQTSDLSNENPIKII